MDCKIMRFGVQNSVIAWGMHQKQINVLCLMISKKRLWQKKKGRISTLEILIILFYHKSLSQVALWRTGTRVEILGLGSRSLFLHIIIFIGRPSWRSFLAYRSFRVFFRGFLWHIPNCIMLYINTLKHVAISR